MSKAILKQKPARSPEVEEWMKREIEEQRKKYEKIAYEINVKMAEQRERDGTGNLNKESRLQVLTGMEI